MTVYAVTTGCLSLVKFDILSLMTHIISGPIITFSFFS